MARHIYVHGPDGGERIYEAPLGGEGAVGDYWSRPAGELGLPLLGSIYEVGWREGIAWSGDQLDKVEAELPDLERRWASMPFDDYRREDLAGRMVSMREALAAARRVGGILTIV